MWTVILLLWALPVAFLTGLAFGMYEGKKSDGILEPLPVKRRAYSKPSLIIIDGEFVRHK